MKKLICLMFLVLIAFSGKPKKEEVQVEVVEMTYEQWKNQGQ